MCASLSVGRVLPKGLQGCAFPLLKCMFCAFDSDAGFFSLTQEMDEITLMMDERCRRAFDDAAAVATVEYAPHKWRAFALRLGAGLAEVPGLVCFLATLMAEANISILNLSSHDRDFLLVQEADMDAAINDLTLPLVWGIFIAPIDLRLQALRFASRPTFIHRSALLRWVSNRNLVPSRERVVLCTRAGDLVVDNFLSDFCTGFGCFPRVLGCCFACIYDGFSGGFRGFFDFLCDRTRNRRLRLGGCLFFVPAFRWSQSG